MTEIDPSPSSTGRATRGELGLLVAGAAGIVAVLSVWQNLGSRLYAASHGSAVTIASFTIVGTALIIGGTALVASLCEPRLGVASSDRGDREPGSLLRDRAGGSANEADWILLAPSYSGGGNDEECDADRVSTAAVSEGVSVGRGRRR